MSTSESQSWPYESVAALPLTRRIEDHLLVAVRKLTSALDTPGVCDAILEGVEAVFGATSSWIMLHDPAANVLRTARFRGRAADVYDKLEIPADHGMTGLTFTRREIQFMPDVVAEDRWFNAERVHASGLRSVFMMPLVADKTAIGVLGLDSPRFGLGQPPADLDVKQLEVFAAQAAVGIINARLYEASQQDRARLRALLRERRELRQQVIGLREEVRAVYSIGDIVGESASMRHVLGELAQVAPSDVTVLLLGETGTGKELLARAIHERSSRASRPFVPVNCAALPETLVESEMFGHERGAFTGAQTRKPGRFEQAHRGTLFLDEIGDLPLPAQAKLLRALQDGEVQRVGGVQTVKVDVRLVAATNQDLSARVAERAFREDLYYRLSVFPIRIPPLRERPEDIPALASYIASRSAQRTGKRVSGIAEDALAVLMQYSWPGNVRELQNVIERAVILTAEAVITRDTIRLDDVRQPKPPVAAPVAAPPAPVVPPSPVSLADAERAAIVRALRASDGRISGAQGAATLLGLKPTTLHAKMKKLGVRREDALQAPQAGAADDRAARDATRAAREPEGSTG